MLHPSSSTLLTEAHQRSDLSNTEAHRRCDPFYFHSGFWPLVYRSQHRFLLPVSDRRPMDPNNVPFSRVLAVGLQIRTFTFFAMIETKIRATVLRELYKPILNITTVQPWQSRAVYRSYFTPYQFSLDVDVNKNNVHQDS